MVTRLTGAARLGDDVAAGRRSCGHHVSVAHQDCASVVCSAACGVVSVLPSPLCDPAVWSLSGSENGGGGSGSETKNEVAYVRHHPIGLFGQTRKQKWGTVQCVSGKRKVF